MLYHIFIPHGNWSAIFPGKDLVNALACTKEIKTIKIDNYLYHCTFQMKPAVFSFDTHTHCKSCSIIYKKKVHCQYYNKFLSPNVPIKYPVSSSMAYYFINFNCIC